jgi:tRNA-2-methylthio-N6-dimethylallyladenosine synthase
MKSLFLHTFGCQMNESDSQRMRESLAKDSWQTVDSPELADLILVNTCAIREKAEQKLFSALGRYREEKVSRGALIGVAGCVAQQEKGKILDRAPYVDFVLGPDNLAALPGIVRQLEAEAVRKPIVQTSWMDSSAYLFPRADPEASRGKVTAFVTAMKGCDNVCSFCVVPHTRGRELSRPYAEIVREVADLTAVGVREVTLIGQNVNSFSGGCSFPELLRRVAAVPDLWRLRFTTSHPHDFSRDLRDCYAPAPLGEAKLMPHLHLPVQCGSDAVLKRMRRDYTVADYEAKIADFRRLAPEVALTSDIIVGFPGETEVDFEGTLALIERVQFDNLFSFIYSSRPHTTARLKEEEWGVLPEAVKVARLEGLQALQRRIAARHMAAVVGTSVEVLVEGHSRTDAARRTGHTGKNQTVNFSGEGAPGSIARVLVEASTASSLSGRQVSVARASSTLPFPKRALTVLSI